MMGWLGTIVWTEWDVSFIQQASLIHLVCIRQHGSTNMTTTNNEYNREQCWAGKMPIQQGASSDKGENSCIDECQYNGKRIKRESCSGMMAIQVIQGEARLRHKVEPKKVSAHNSCEPHVLSHYCVLSTQWFEPQDLVIVCVCNGLQSTMLCVCKGLHGATQTNIFWHVRFE